MICRKWTPILILFLILPFRGYLQKVYVKDYFRSPMDIRLLLSGTFGEIRSDHFHSGIDIKTNGAEGLAVYAIADGYVSRIKVSAYGYGKAIYITHPNGYVSVYGHLNRYNAGIGAYVRNAQYARESFEIELFPAEGELPVRKGDLIAYSGNSGSSGGPHVHFEIREEASQKPVNPLLFGYDVKDFYKPGITSVKIYPEGENSRVNGSEKAVRYLVEGWGAEHRLAGNPSVRLSGNVSFAIQVYDQQNDTDNKNGPYSISLFIDDKLVFDFVMESFSFDETRYVNSLLDYPEYIRNNVRLQRTRIEPGNKLSLYKKAENNGVFTFNDSLHHTIQYEVKDVEGNTATLSFIVKGEKTKSAAALSSAPEKQASASKFPVSIFNHATPNTYKNGLIVLEAPVGAFYDSFTFKYDTARRIAGTFAPVHKIHEKITPVHESVTLSLRSAGLPDGLQDKALIVKIKEDGKSFTSAGGKYERGGYVATKIREFGNYSIAVDTVPPVVKSLNPETFAKLATQKSVKLKITDELSGIAAYKGQVNGKWVLMDYDAKNDLLIYNIDENLLPGKNTFLLEVRDGKNNRAYYSAIFYL